MIAIITMRVYIANLLLQTQLNTKNPTKYRFKMLIAHMHGPNISETQASHNNATYERLQRFGSHGEGEFAAVC